MNAIDFLCELCPEGRDVWRSVLPDYTGESREHWKAKYDEVVRGRWYGGYHADGLPYVQSWLHTQRWLAVVRDKKRWWQQRKQCLDCVAERKQCLRLAPYANAECLPALLVCDYCQTHCCATTRKGTPCARRSAYGRRCGQHRETLVDQPVDWVETHWSGRGAGG